MRPIARLLAVFVASLALATTGCAQMPSGQRNVITNKGFELVVNWCVVNADRSAECELTATSTVQDFKAGFAYPILQDQSGAQFRMVPKEGGLGRYTMIAGEPYTISYVNKDILPTTVTSVRGLVGSWAFWTLKNLKAGEFPVAFADIPAKPPKVVEAPPPPPTKPETPEQPFAEAPASWETVGFWTYDQADGLRVPEGLVLIEAPGAMGQHSWQRRLELKVHNELAPRQDRIVWPVYLSRTEKRVCVDAPYPSYSGYVDLPADEYDGVYAFASCKGGAQ